MKQRIYIFTVILMLLISATCFIYSPLAQYINEKAALKAVSCYDRANAEKTENQKNLEWKLAEQYNKGLLKTDDYENILNIKDGMMGYIEIPKINVKLPIYHGTDKATLENGIGHMENSTFPIGGKNTHAVLTGHTGLQSAKFFDDISLLKINDCFQIKVLDKELSYKVVRIKTVYPNNYGKLLDANQDLDLVTLVTCVPYGINNQRLLVTGKRTRSKEKTEEQPVVCSSKDKLISRAIVVFIVLAVLTVISRRRGK